MAMPSLASEYLTCEQLSESSGMSMMELGELVSYSALKPIKRDAMHSKSIITDHWVFSTQWLKPLCAASKMRNDFDLDLFTVAILLGNFQRIDELEQHVHALQLQMQKMLPPDAY